MNRIHNKLFLLIAVLAVLMVSSAGKARAQGQVIDEIAAVVGQNIILESQLETQYLQARAQGMVSGGAQTAKCQILEGLLFEKLMLNQAELDSVEVSDAQVEQDLDNRLRYFIAQFGSQEKLEEFYQKSIIEIKNDFRDLVRKQLMVQEVQRSITESLKVTPSDVRNFYKSIPQDSIPLINSEVEILQIVKMPPVTMEQKREVKERLRELRTRIVDGESFATLAILYSEDPGSASKGGELGFYGRGELFPEFEAVAFKLKEGEVSDIVETEAGFHIIQLIERKGEYVNVRHILLQTKVSPIALAEAKQDLDSLAAVIRSGEITFAEAVENFSDDPGKNSGGVLINPQTGTTKFEMDQLDPQVSFAIDRLEVGDISNAVPMKTEDSKDAYRILMLKSRTEPHRANLKEDYNRIYNWTLEYKQEEKIREWVNKNTGNAFIKINDRYQDCPFEFEWKVATID
jgi:peptidyl-prolyl cis-trans isomerase SurA